MVRNMKTPFFLSVLAAFTASAHANTGAGACLVDPLTNVQVSSQYGKYRAGEGGTVHQGHDLVPKNRAQKEIYASAEGEVVFVGFRGGAYGNMIAIKRTNAGAQTGDFILYKHIKNSFYVKKGDMVKPGQHIGYYSGTKNSVVMKKGDQYDPHLHFEYMVQKSRAQQYEYNPDTRRAFAKFMTLGRKTSGDNKLVNLSSSRYYTDPTPYLCNDWPMTNPSNTGYGFKPIRAQYNFILAKLGQSGFEVGGVPNNVVNGDAPSTAEYSVAMACSDLEMNQLATQNPAASEPVASAPKG